MCLVYVSTSIGTSNGVSSTGTSVLGSKNSIKSNGGCVWEKTILRVDFRMWCPYALVIASPICCVTVSEGVGAVCEWPKNCRVRVVFEFQWLSADRKMPIGDGKVVARSYISLAFGLLALNCFRGWNGGGVVPKSIALNIGPNLPNPSIAMGMSTALLLRRFFMTASPGMLGETL